MADYIMVSLGIYMSFGDVISLLSHVYHTGTLKGRKHQCQEIWAIPTSLVLAERACWLLSVSQSCVFLIGIPCTWLAPTPGLPRLPKNIITSFLNQTTFSFLLLFSYTTTAPQCSRLRGAHWKKPSRSAAGGRGPAELRRAPRPLGCCRCVRAAGGGCGRSLAPCGVGWHRAPLSIGPPAAPTSAEGCERIELRGENHHTAPSRLQWERRQLQPGIKEL